MPSPHSSALDAAGLRQGMAAAVLLLASCAAPRPGGTPLPPAAATAAAPAPVPAVACLTYRESGIASWYGRDFQGRKTASGETFDMNGVSAAHRTLPLGTVVRVTNLDNYRSIKVRVNDRGPLERNRVIELSLGAARELGFVEAGMARVKIEAAEPLPEGEATYTVLAGSFLEEENALALKERLGRKFETIVIDRVETNLGRSYRVLVGSYGSEEKAERVAAKLTIEGVEPVVLRKD